MAKHMLRNFDTCYPVKMGCSRVPEEPCVEFFIDADLIGSGAEDILQGPLGDALSTYGYQQWPFFMVP